jgi:HAD superfamily hydrolase (TIGR01509 family)
MVFEAILFDCDGVLADSEPATNGVLRDMLEERGWTLTEEACMALFVGRAVRDQRVLIEHHTGLPLTDEWLAVFRERRNVALQARITAIPNVHHAVQRIHQHMRGRMACASGADRFKVEMMLRQLELLHYFDGQIFSGHELPRTKPFPDVYLAAAAALNVPPARCAVVEDTVTGVTAGVAAGATVFAYAPPTTRHVDAQALRQAGAVEVFTDMAELPGVLGF